MFYLMIVAMCSTAFAVLFFFYEIHEGIENYNRLAIARRETVQAPRKGWFRNTRIARGGRGILMFPKFIRDVIQSFKSLAIDLLLTFGILVIFRTGAGMMGTLIALTTTGLVSMFIIFRRWWDKRKPGYKKAMQDGYEAVR